MESDDILRLLSRLRSFAEDDSPAPAMAPRELDKQAAVSLHLEVYRVLDTMEALSKHCSQPQSKPSFIRPCSPSVALAGLRPIALAELQLGTVHHGRVLFGSLCVDAFIANGVMTVFQDQQDAGKAVRMCVCNAASSSSDFAGVQKMFPKGLQVAVKEPFFNRSLDGQVGIRVDNPGDVEKLNDPASIRQRVSASAVDDPVELRRLGNCLFAAKDWKGAIECYTRGIAISQERSSRPSSSASPGNVSEEQQSEGASGDTVVQSNESNMIMLAYSNRAEAYMKIGNYQQALKDSDAALTLDKDHEKSLFRKGRALHGLNRYEEACTSLEALLAKDPERKEVRSFLNSIRGSLDPPQGNVVGLDLAYFFLKKGPAPKYSDYIGPVIVLKTRDARGRGLFASSDVQPGDLLLVSNAMALCKQDLRRKNLCIDWSAKRANLACEEDLVTKIVSLGMESPNFLRQLYSLAASPSQDTMDVPSMDLFTSSCETVEGLQIDITRIREIVWLNSFGNRTPVTQIPVPSSDTGFEETGLWLLPSFINHSCIPNASFLKVGEAVIVFAASKIPAGEEITLPYFNVFLPVKLREEGCNNWGFQCSCKRCVAERSMEDWLKGVSCQFQSAYREAQREVVSAVSAQEAKPIGYYPECLKLSKVYKKLRKMLVFSKLTSLEKKWVLASYLSAFLGKWFISWHGEGTSSSDDDNAMEVMEAMRSCVPGSLYTLSLVARLAMGAKMVLFRKGASADSLMEQAREECVCNFGKQNSQALDQIVELAFFMFPIM